MKLSENEIIVIKAPKYEQHCLIKQLTIHNLSIYLSILNI